MLSSSYQPVVGLGRARARPEIWPLVLSSLPHPGPHFRWPGPALYFALLKLVKNGPK